VTTIGEALPYEMRRCRQILVHAKEIGPEGVFLVHMLQLALLQAERALANGDVAGMLVAYEELKDFKE
jgi:hypothetical protein